MPPPAQLLTRRYELAVPRDSATFQPLPNPPNAADGWFRQKDLAVS